MAESKAVADKSVSTANRDVTVNLMGEGTFDASQLIVLPGGSGEEEFVFLGDRANPCPLTSTNCYDRPVGEAPYPSFILGQFNTQRFTIADEFVPQNTGDVTNVCWLGRYSSAVDCPAEGFPVSAYGDFKITYFVDNGFGFPLTGAPHAGPFDMANATLAVTQGNTGDPVGFNNPTSFEVGLSAIHAAVPVSAGTCYWIEFDWTGITGGTCFFIMTLSYENVEGNRRLLRMDAALGNPYQDNNRTNLDTTVCIGGTIGTLVNSNILGCGDVNTAPANDNPATATNLPCGSSVTGNNTLAVWDAQYPEAACRKSSTNPNQFNAGDVWYSFAATATSALISACDSLTLTGQVHGDSLMQGYKEVVVGGGFVPFDPGNPPFTPPSGNFQVIGCNDDACNGGLSELCLTGLTVGQTYWVRFWAFSPVGQGKFALEVTCPCPVAPNDFCVDAIAIPPNNDGDPGWTDLGGRITNSRTSQATTDGNVTGCPGVANTAKGVWYTIIGNGNLVRMSTDTITASAGFDTRLTVYCSENNDCNGLTCVAANDDIDAGNQNFFSEVEFCAKLGKKYFVLVHGFGSSSGVFGLLTEEVRDSSNVPVACCDDQACDILCTFEIPQNAVTEQDAISAGSPAYLSASTPCENTTVGVAAHGDNGGCSVAAGPNRKFTPVTIGVAMKGDTRSFNGARDFDWFALINELPINKAFLMDYTIAAEAPIQFVPWQANPNYSLCQVIAFGSWVNNTTFCGSFTNRRAVYSTAGQIPLSGGAAGTGGDFLFRILNTSAAVDGYSCANGLIDYWFRINWVLALDECPSIPTPAGTVGQDFDDERDATATTYDGTVGSGAALNEPCNFATPNDGVHRGKGGCNEAVPTDGDFIRLTPDRPMIGVMDGLLGGDGAGRDVDWYKFDIGVRSIVTLKVSSGGPVTFFLTENSCENESITFGQAATLGHCGARTLDADDVMVLEAGTYIVVGVHSDAFSGGTIFAAINCTDPGADIGVAKYRIDLTTAPLPSCTVTCPVGAVSETEICPNVFEEPDTCAPTNNGCAFATFGADSITSGTPVCGTLFSTYQPFPDDVFNLDTDYWEFTVASRQKLSFSVVSDGPVIAQIGVTGANGSLCDADLPNPFTGQGGGLRVLTSANADPCTAGTPTVNDIYLEPGTYSLILTPGIVGQAFVFADLQCVNSHQLSYSAAISLSPIGSCTVGSDCLITTAAECSGLGGSFVADGGTSCGNLFTASAFSSGCSAYSTISGLSIQVALCGDNEFAQQVIPPFSFFGVTHTQVNISSNGYITFGGISSDTPRSFADIGNPNNVIAPFWNDWLVACSQTVGTGTPTTVWIQSTGGLGNEVTIIEWKDLRKFELLTQTANFQVVLFHATGEIEFRYGAFSGLKKKDLDTVAVGVEDGCGLRGVNVPLSGAFLQGNSCVRLALSQTPPCCPGDADGSGAVNFDDITEVISFWLTNYGAGTGPGDANCDGVVNFDDITEVISFWLSVCP